jgi:hypothetical protein
MATATEKRACKATTKAGKPCTTGPLEDDDYCMAHTDQATREKAGFVAKNGKQGRHRKPRLVDLMREWLDDHPEVMGVIQDALQAERAVVVGNGPSAELVMVPDWPTRLVAYREFCDRCFGKPHQTSTVLTQDAVDRDIEELLRDLAANDRDTGKPGIAGTTPAAQSRAGV